MADGKILSLEEFALLEAQARAGDREAKECLYADYKHTTDPGARSQKLRILQNPPQR